MVVVDLASQHSGSAYATSSVWQPTYRLPGCRKLRLQLHQRRLLSAARVQSQPPKTISTMLLGTNASQASPITFDAFKQHHDSTDAKDRALYVVHAHTYFPYSTLAEQKKADEFLAVFKAAFADRSGVKFDDISTRGGDGWPHPMPQFETAFTKGHLADILPWLMFNRPDGFSVLLHPFTAQLLEDHTSRAVWLGPKLEIRLPSFVKMEQQIAKDGKDEATLLWPFV